MYIIIGQNKINPKLVWVVNDDATGNTYSCDSLGRVENIRDALRADFPHNMYEIHEITETTTTY